jgi:hypothetical protein
VVEAGTGVSPEELVEELVIAAKVVRNFSLRAHPRLATML